MSPAFVRWCKKQSLRLLTALHLYLGHSCVVLHVGQAKQASIFHCASSKEMKHLSAPSLAIASSKPGAGSLAVDGGTVAAGLAYWGFILSLV